MRRPSRSACAFIAAVAIGSAAMTGAMTGPANAQGLFEALFGGISRAIRGEARPLSAPQAYAPERGYDRDPVTRFFDDLTGQRSGQRVAAAPSGPSRGFCVRTCDGSYFPVQSRPGMSAAEACSSFCPASETKVFSGSNIDYAVARDGQRYTDLQNAFVYRQKLVDGCTCNGKRTGGLAAIPAQTDPTLRPGDIVATAEGFKAFTPNRHAQAEFTPVDLARVNKSVRETLASTKIAPNHTEPTVEDGDTTASIGNDADARVSLRSKIEPARDLITQR